MVVCSDDVVTKAYEIVYDAPQIRNLELHI